jgi:hypothetical protein
MSADGPVPRAGRRQHAAVDTGVVGGDVVLPHLLAGQRVDLADVGDRILAAVGDAVVDLVAGVEEHPVVLLRQHQGGVGVVGDVPHPQHLQVVASQPNSLPELSAANIRLR